MSKFKPKIEADKQVMYSDEDDEEVMEGTGYTNFEELQKRVEVLVEVVNKQSDILNQNGLTYTEKEDAPYFDEDKVYTELEAKE